MVGDLWFESHAGDRHFRLLQNVQTGSGVQSASFSVVMGGSFTGSKAVGMGS